MNVTNNPEKMETSSSIFVESSIGPQRNATNELNNHTVKPSIFHILEEELPFGQVITLTIEVTRDGTVTHRKVYLLQHLQEQTSNGKAFYVPNPEPFTVIEGSTATVHATVAPNEELDFLYRLQFDKVNTLEF